LLAHRPSLRIKREAHLKSAERRDTCGEPLSGDTELSI